MIDRVDYLFLQFEVLAISARLRRLGHPDTADVVDRWASSRDFAEQVGRFVAADTTTG